MHVDSTWVIKKWLGKSTNSKVGGYGLGRWVARDSKFMVDDAITWK